MLVACVSRQGIEMTLHGSTFMQSPCIPEGAPEVSACIVTGPGVGQSIQLRRVASLFGGKRGCKVVLQHATVGRRQCVIVNTGSQLILRDLNTKGRTLRNGLKAEEEALADADQLKLGPWEFRLDVTMREISGASDSPVIVDLEPDPTIFAMEREGRPLTKLSRAVSILGRAAGVDYQVDDREVSGEHAIVFTYLHKPAIFDLVSENGTFVNGQRVMFSMLNDGDEIGLGACKLRFRAHVPGQPAKPGKDGAPVLKPTPFASPEGTYSDLIDFSNESMFR